MHALDDTGPAPTQAPPTTPATVKVALVLQLLVAVALGSLASWALVVSIQGLTWQPGEADDSTDRGVFLAGLLLSLLALAVAGVLGAYARPTLRGVRRARTTSTIALAVAGLLCGVLTVWVSLPVAMAALLAVALLHSGTARPWFRPRY